MPSLEVSVALPPSLEPESVDALRHLKPAVSPYAIRVEREYVNVDLTSAAIDLLEDIEMALHDHPNPTKLVVTARTHQE